MQAQLIKNFGDASVFELSDIETPKPERDQVLIKIHATSVNQIDCKIRSGVVTDIAPQLPAILHSDVAGVIEAIGNGVTGFNIGDKVYGCVGGVRGMPGTLAQYVAADAHLIAKAPNKLPLNISAALPLVGITAWMALFDKVQVKSGDTVLIHGGVGGVGHIALQLAKWAGARVYTTVNKQDDIELAYKLGADFVINSSQETVVDYVKRLTNNEGFAIIFDTIGMNNLANSMAAAAYNGKIVTTAARVTLDLSPMHNKALSLNSVFMLLPLLTGKKREQFSQILTKIASIVDLEQLTPLINKQQFNLADAALAHQAVESGNAKGKVIINIIS